MKKKLYRMNYFVKAFAITNFKINKIYIYMKKL